MQAAFEQATRGLVPIVETDAPATVLVNPMRRGDRMIVHVLNYDYDEGADKVAAKRNVRIKLKLPADAKGVAGEVLHASPDAPGADQSIPHTLGDDRIEFTVPELRAWSVVHWRLLPR